MSHKEAREGFGCLLAMWSLLVTTPMWLVLLFVILQAGGDAIPYWAWLLYFCYVPTYFLGVIFNELAKALFRSAKDCEEAA